MKPDLEAELMRRTHAGEFPRAVIGDLLDRGAIASPKQGWSTLEKWARKGWYDYGVALDLGWMTEKAPCGKSVQREPVVPIVPLVTRCPSVTDLHAKFARAMDDEIAKVILGRQLTQ